MRTGYLVFEPRRHPVQKTFGMKAEKVIPKAAHKTDPKHTLASVARQLLERKEKHRNTENKVSEKEELLQALMFLGTQLASSVIIINSKVSGKMKKDLKLTTPNCLPKS